MSHTRKDLPQAQVELTITITPAEYQAQLVKAAERISQRQKIAGFRPGKAPFDLVKRTVGEMALLQEALEPLVKETYYEAVMAEKLDVVGMPKVDLQKMAPGNDIVYTAVASLLPSVTVADLKKIKIKRDEKPVTDVQVDEVVENLRKLQAKEVIKAGEAGGDDMILLDMDMFLDNVPVDGGQAKNYRVYLSEEHYIPGFNEKVKGMKKGDEREFSLDFPTTHYQKHLAGKTVAIKVKAHDVFERQMPELDEAFAKALGQDSVEKLRELLRTNIGREAAQKADQQAEIEMLDTVVAKSEFGEIPEVLVDVERRKMFYELTRDLERNGVSVEQYLSDIKKTQAELEEGFKEQAIKRAKAALVSRQIAKEQNLFATEDEVAAEIAHMKEVYKENPDYIKQLDNPEVHETIHSIVQNRKVITWLKEQTLEK